MSKPARKLVAEALRLSPKARLGASWDRTWRKELDRRWEEAERTGDWGEPIKLPRAARTSR